MAVIYLTKMLNAHTSSDSVLRWDGFPLNPQDKRQKRPSEARLDALLSATNVRLLLGH